MSLSAMVEMARRAAKRSSVIPAESGVAVGEKT